jgi:hypothetical protein
MASVSAAWAEPSGMQLIFNLPSGDVGAINQIR